MNIDLAHINALPPDAAYQAMFHACGSRVFAESVCDARPFASEDALRAACDKAFSRMGTDDWLEAFTHHPMIGDVASIRAKFAATAHLAASEQSGVQGASDEVFRQFADCNVAYRDKFGFIFIICATGKSADFMLDALKQRLQNDRGTELENAANEQKKIAWLRLEKLGKK